MHGCVLMEYEWHAGCGVVWTRCDINVVEDGRKNIHPNKVICFGRGKLTIYLGFHQCAQSKMSSDFTY